MKAFLDPKYEGVEFDVRETLDHEFILCHDPIINNKLIKDVKYSDLPKYIPRLKDILKIKTSKIGVLNYILNTNNNLPDLDFVCILNNFLNQKLIQDLKPLEVFSYGLISSATEYKYPQVFYIVD